MGDQGEGSTVAVAESLTGGMLSSRLARREGASDWFRGGVVAYSRLTKERLLGIGDVPVVSEAAARAMAENVARTVWIATFDAGRTEAHLHHFDGDPTAVCNQTCDAAEALLAH
jgi:nicotinamide-nucleotide amidase